MLPLAALPFRLLMSTWRLHTDAAPLIRRLADEPRVGIATYHGMLLHLVAFADLARRHGRRFVVMLSPSRDGRLLDRIVIFPTMRWGQAGPAWARAFRTAARDLRREAYNVSRDLQGLLKSSAVSLLAPAPRRLGVAGQREGERASSRAPCRRPPGRRHVVDDYLQAARFLGAVPEPVRFDLPVCPDAAAAIAQRLAIAGVGNGQPLVVINPSASVRWKHWPVSRWAQVAHALAQTAAVVLVGSRDQVARHTEVLRLAATRAPRHAIIDLTGQTTLSELVALLDRCAVHLAPDTGSAHIAAALGRPVVGLCPPTTPWRNAPYGQEHRAVHHAGHWRPALPHLCLRQRRCLQAVEPEERRRPC